MKNVPKNLRFEVSPEEFRALLKRVERIEKELIRGGNLYDRVVDGKPLSDAEVEHIRRLRRREACNVPKVDGKPLTSGFRSWQRQHSAASKKNLENN